MASLDDQFGEVEGNDTAQRLPLGDLVLFQPRLGASSSPVSSSSTSFVSSSLRCIAFKGVHGREDVGLQEPPQGVIREILAHVRRGRQQQQVVAGPRERPPRNAPRDTRQRLGDAVAVGLADGEVGLAVGAELVRLVEDAEVIRFDSGILKPGERAIAPEGIDADDDQVAGRPREGIARLRVRAADDVEVEPEQRPQFPLPVADQPRRGAISTRRSRRLAGTVLEGKRRPTSATPTGTIRTLVTTVPAPWEFPRCHGPAHSFAETSLGESWPTP